MKKHIFKIGNQEYHCYDSTVNRLADLCDGKLSKEQIKYAIQQLQEQITENTWDYSIDTFSLLLDFCEKQNVKCAEVIKQNVDWRE